MTLLMFQLGTPHDGERSMPALRPALREPALSPPREPRAAHARHHPAGQRPRVRGRPRPAAAAAAWRVRAAGPGRGMAPARPPRSGCSSRPPSACPRSRTSSVGTSCSFAGSSSRGRWGGLLPGDGGGLSLADLANERCSSARRRSWPSRRSGGRSERLSETK